MKVSIYNIKGKEVDTILLPKNIFEISLNPDLVYQVVVVQTANRRRMIAHTKDRSEARGGGRKPWRQKGTGRARHGSRRSPLWRGGGVTFGPRKNKNYSKKINKKARKKALFMVLSEKLRKDLLIFLDKIEAEKIKTKEMAQTIEKYLSLAGRVKKLTVNKPKKGEQGKPSKKENTDSKNKSLLIVLPKIDKNIIFSVRNIPNVETIQAKDLNALDLLRFKYLIMPKESVKVIKETFLADLPKKAKVIKKQKVSPDK